MSEWHRYLALALIGLWMAPGVGALAIGLHMAEHHAEPHHHSLVAEQLAAALVHGHHHHTATVPDHDHQVTIERTADSRPPDDSVALVPQPEAPSAHRDGRVLPGTRHRRAPRDALIYAHCSLLL